MKWQNCVTCGMMRPHHAHGQCPDCYHSTRHASGHLGLCKDPKCKTRGQKVLLTARELCVNCYNRNRYSKTLNKYPTLREIRSR